MKERFAVLDIFRGIFSSLVVLFHLSAFSATPIINNEFIYNSDLFVDFFFVLSGFVLSGPFINNNKPLKITEFYTKRIFRIYPAYIAALILSLLLKHYAFDGATIGPFSGWINSFWHWKDINNKKEIARTFLLIGPTFDTKLIDLVIWSLIVEMNSSFLLPFFIVIVSKSNITFNVCFFFAIYALRHKEPVEYFTTFYLGILLAKYKNELGKTVDRMPTWGVFMVGILAIILYNSNNEYFNINKDPQHHFKNFIGGIITAIGSCAIIILVTAKQTMAAFLEKKPFILLGKISYSFYLIHLPLLITFCSIFHKGDTFSYCYIFSTTFLSAIIISILLYNYIEVPFQKLAKWLVDKYKTLSLLEIR